MVGVQGNRIVSVPLESIVHKPKGIDREDYIRAGIAAGWMDGSDK